MKEKQIKTHSPKLVRLVFMLAVLIQSLASTTYGQGPWENPCFTTPAYGSTINCVMEGNMTNVTLTCYFTTSLQAVHCYTTTASTYCKVDPNYVDVTINTYKGNCVFVVLPNGTTQTQCQNAKYQYSNTTISSTLYAAPCTLGGGGGGGTNMPPGGGGYGMKPAIRDGRFLQAAVVQVPRRSVALKSAD